MLEKVIALALAGGIFAAGASQMSEIEDAVNMPELRHAVGISDVVYDCATEALTGEDADSLTALIKGIAEDPDNEAGDVRVAALRECVMLDPFGWAGTEQEWAIELLGPEYGGK